MREAQKMTFDDLIAETARFVDRRHGETLAVVAAVFAVIREHVGRGGTVEIPGFGEFSTWLEAGVVQRNRMNEIIGHMEGGPTPGFSPHEDFVSFARAAQRDR